MNTRKLIGLTSIFILTIGLVAFSLANRTSLASEHGEILSAAIRRPVSAPTPRLAPLNKTPVPPATAAGTAADPSAVTAPIAPQPIPTPNAQFATAASPIPNPIPPMILAAAVILFSFGCLGTLLRQKLLGRQSRSTQSRPGVPRALLRRLVLLWLLSLPLISCQAQAANPLPPDQYLDHALNWLEANAVTAAEVDWESVRAEAEKMAAGAETTADTYPAIEYAQAQLNDGLASFRSPNRSVWEPVNIGLTAIYPQNIIVEIEDNSPAAAADIQIGDQLVQVNGVPPQPDEKRERHVDFLIDLENPTPATILLRRGDRQWEVTLTPAKYENKEQLSSRTFARDEITVAYFDLLTDVGTQMYPTETHAAIAAVDGPDTCGWIIDLRRNKGGNLWTYFAALSPILGNGELGGFLYVDGSRESWVLEDGKVFWADEERQESFVRGARYQLQRPSPPVALLIGPLTEAAGELVVAAFNGWGTIRTFGETTRGTPHLVLHTPLSDGALIFVSGAHGIDRQGNVYNGPITPDESVEIDWQRLGSEDDPVITAALDWLATRPACRE